MHPKDELLRAYFDEELPEEQAEQVRGHLTSCTACRNRLEEMSALARRVQARIQGLVDDQTGQKANAQAAYRQFSTSNRMNLPKKETLTTMFTRRPVWTALTIIALLAVVFTLTPARAWAGDFLGLFRVEKVQVISFNPDAMEDMPTRMEENKMAFERIFQEDMAYTEHQVPETVASVEEAAGVIGFTPRLPADLSDAELRIQPGFNAVFTIDQPKLQELIDAMGADFTLPEETDGQVVTIDVPDALEARADCSKDPDVVYQCLSLIQLHSPVVNAPDGMPVEKMAEAMFNFMGMSEDEAREMSQRIDWATTMVIPVPSNGNFEVKDVNIDGVTGSLILEPLRNGFMMVWVKDGVLYGLSGMGSEAEALSIAVSMQ